MQSLSLFMTSFLLLAVTGCSSMQPSTYQSVATADKTTITATGSAADVAAGSTTVGACHTCNTNEGSSVLSAPRQRRTTRPPSRYQQAANRVQDRAVNTAALHVSVRVDEAIKEIFQFGQ